MIFCYGGAQIMLSCYKPRNIQVGKLSNGIPIALLERNTSSLVSFCFAVGTGTSRETKQDNGLAHMATHMHILGTRDRTAQNISTTIEEMGCEIQFFVHPEKTEYYLHLSKDNLKKPLSIMAECFMNSVFPEDVLEREQTVIEQEIVERRDNPFVSGMDLLNQVSFPNQGYGMCPLGTIESMYNLSTRMLQEHHETHFYPANMAIGVHGDIDLEDLSNLLEKQFGRFKSHDKTLMSRLEPEFCSTGGLIEKQTSNELAHIFMAFPLDSQNPKEGQTAQIISKILGSGTSSRFFQGLRQERALGYTMGSRVESYAGHSFIKFYFSGWKKQEDYNLLGEGAKILNAFPNLITDQELITGKNKILYDLAMAYENPMQCAGMIAEQSLYEGSPTEISQFIDPLNAILLDDVKSLSQQILLRKPTVSFVGSYSPISYGTLLNNLRLEDIIPRKQVA
jgi:predicted Zn-dependent peptidase